MDFIQAALLGLIQGLTEFLPVSSSGHLVITQKLFGLNPPEEFFFNICAHLGSLIAVLLFFRIDVKELALAAFRLGSQLAQPKGFPLLFQSSSTCRTLLFLLIATFVTGVVGFLFHSYFVESFSSVKRIGVSWLITAGLLLLAQWKLKQPSSNHSLIWPMAVLIGFFQALALFPGISRSGATLTAALLCGLNKESAFRFASCLRCIEPLVRGSRLRLIVYKAYVNDGDVGCGAPGYLSWHKCNVLQMSDDERIAYVREAFPGMSDEDKLELTVFLIVEKLNDDDDQNDDSH